MSDRFYSDKRQRRSKRYQLLHAQLRAEVAEGRKPEPSKSERKRQVALEYRQNG
jgi:hypothetical protein